MGLKQTSDNTDSSTSSTLPDVVDRYERYVRDNHGDVSDTLHLCEVMWNAGGQHMLKATVAFSDLLPMARRMYERVGRLVDMLERIERTEQSKGARDQ